MKKIIIASNGWVCLGEATMTATAIVLDDAYVIRRWGTTKGIGEIALTGITPNTILDPLPRTEIPRSSVIMILDCNT